MSNSLWPHGLQHGRLPCPSPSLLEFAQTYAEYHGETYPGNHYLHQTGGATVGEETGHWEIRIGQVQEEKGCGVIQEAAMDGGVGVFLLRDGSPPSNLISFYLFKHQFTYQWWRGTKLKHVLPPTAASLAESFPPQPEAVISVLSRTSRLWGLRGPQMRRERRCFDFRD